MNGQLVLDLFPAEAPKRREYVSPCPFRDGCGAYQLGPGTKPDGTEYPRGCTGERYWCMSHGEEPGDDFIECWNCGAMATVYETSRGGAGVRCWCGTESYHPNYTKLQIKRAWKHKLDSRRNNV